VDIVFVHARALEDKFVANGFGVNAGRDVQRLRRRGAPDDPQASEGRKRAGGVPGDFVEGEPFISRGDESGTHRRRRRSGLRRDRPQGAWYVEAGRDGEVLTMATRSGVHPLRPGHLYRLPEEDRPRRRAAGR